ncbi:hypothetical protein ACHAPT_011050 [Fusarium lateritium]
MPLVRNPILPGFNADPSIIRVNNDYYIATSTMEWYPGLQIHHSKDLANWPLITRPLNEKRLLDLRGEPDSGGVWAPCLTHDGEKFWIVYTDCKEHRGSFKDCHNYIIHAPTIHGPWSDPVHLNSSGFDPSLFHDDDGRKWFLNPLWDHRKSAPGCFAGIRLQEYSPEAGKLVGPRKTIFKGTERGFTEGPHLYKRNGWYYLMIAEGGTDYDHACTLARSRDIWGPYETQGQILSSRDAPFTAPQKAGHGDIVNTPDGKTYLVHLCSRPIGQKRRCVLGRETAIQEVYWENDWLHVKNGPVPSLWIDLPAARDDTTYWAEQRYSFDGEELPLDFQWLRTPEKERIFSVDHGKLILVGRESIGSWFEQALVARRQTHFSYDAETVIDFSPDDERQYAGLVAYYSRCNFFYLTVTADSNGQREILLMTTENENCHGTLDGPMVDAVTIPNQGKVKLALAIRGSKLQFFYSLDVDSQEMTKVGPVFDASVLSDDCAVYRGGNPFTGAFVGMACSDLNGWAREAQFDYFIYRPICDESDRYEV